MENQDGKSNPQSTPPLFRVKKDGRALLRRGLTPYLPPPVVKAMGDLDPLLEPYVGPEASITIAFTLLLSFMVLQLMKALSGVSRGGKAIADDDDEAGLAALHQAAAEEFGDTVILCGPMWAGKTRIFYQLAHGDGSLPTVMSLRANAALVPNDSTSGSSSTKALRVLDYPGHSGLQDQLFVEMLQVNPVRVALIVDSTQSMTTAADFLYDLLQHAKDLGSSSKLNVFVACHKSDLSSSKNPRRIKISLRTELEKLIKVRSTLASTAASEGTEASSSPSSSSPWWKEGESLDLDDLQHARLRFESTTCSVGDGIDKLMSFCKNGDME